MESKLEKLGLNQEEASIYLTMLELGGGFASRIAKRNGKNRSSTYHTLSKLCELGLASKSKKGAYQYFSPESPKHLVEIAKLKLDTATSLLPELLSIQNSRADKPKVTFHEKASGIESIFEQTLQAKDEILGYTNLNLLAERFPNMLKKYTKARAKLGIRVRYLSPRPENGIEFLENILSIGNANNALEIFFIDPKQYIIQNEIAIFGNKVAIMSLSIEEPIGLLIESKTVSTTMKAIFDMSWIGASSFVTR